MNGAAVGATLLGVCLPLIGPSRAGNLEGPHQAVGGLLLTVELSVPFVSVALPDGRAATFALSSETEVRIGDRPGTPLDLRPGQEVVCFFESHGTGPVCDVIAVTALGH